MDEILRSIYTTVFSQKFSPDGNELAVCDNFGQLSLYKLNEVLSADNINKTKLPYSKFKATNCSLYSLESTNDYLICAPINELIGWKWKDLSQANSKGSNLKRAFKINFSNHDSEQLETNTLLYDQKINNKELFIGCGNGEIYQFDLEYCKLISKFLGHSDSIYQLAYKNNCNELVSASEDGDIKIWDCKTKNPVSSIKPYTHEICARPSLGKHINCVAIDDDNWMICGGGPKLAMWHFRSMKPMSILEFDNDLFMPNVCRIYDNQIISGGNSKSVFIHTFESKLRTNINTTINSIYDIAMSNSFKLNKIMCVAGTGSFIDVCSNFSYRAFTLSM